MAKNKINLKKFLQTLVLLVFAINWFNAASASFLCVCSDGHTAIENVHSSQCHQEEFQNHNSNDIQLKSNHSCQDILLLSNSLSTASNYLLKNFPTISSVANFVQSTMVSVNRNQVHLPVQYIQTDNKPRIFTDSIRLII